jgi:glycosyltransferase involved in cell wall biosynthesis
VALDLRAAQSRSYRERGIARYVRNLVGALVEHFPELVGSVIVDPDRPPVPDLDRILASGRLRTPGTWPATERIFHAMSPFDLEVPIAELWPRAASRAGMALILTVYDLIPQLFPQIYLEHPAARAAYRMRFHLVRVADHIVTLSASAAADLVEHLGVEESRVTVIGAASERRFRPPASREQAAEQATGVVEGLEPGYIVYNGGVEPRKNMERLIQAYAALPDEVRSRWQLVLVCRMDWAAREHYQLIARQLGIEGRVVLTGYIPDETLILVYQGADLVAHPSLYEGFGLPVSEAMACGAPVIASDTSSLPEIVAEEACFDPRDTASITDLLKRALTDAALRTRLLQWSSQPRPDWKEVAGLAAEVYLRCGSCAPPRRGFRRPRLAVMPAGAADELELVRALAKHALVDVLYDGADPPPDPPPGCASVAAETLERAAALRGGYDAVIVTVCNDRSAASALRLLRRRPAVPPIVIARDVQLAALYESAARTGAVPEGFIAAALAMYPWLSADQLSEGASPRAAAERLGLLMAREVIALSGRFLVGTRRDADLALTDAAPEHAERIALLPDPGRAEPLLELAARASARGSRSST